jgi:hypothetical protein
MTRQSIGVSKLWQKAVPVHGPLFENDTRGSHHGLAATAIHSREAGYIYATVTVVTSKNLARTGRTIHFFQRSP